MDLQEIKLLALLSKRQPPSSRLRIKDAIPFWSKQKIKTTVLPIPSGFLARVNLFLEASRHDVILIQKKTSFRFVELYILRWINPKIIFDMDDAVMFHELEHRKPLTGKHIKNFIQTVRSCCLVVAGNQFLADFSEAVGTPVKILPTPIDLSIYKPKENWSSNGQPLVVGWLGVAGGLIHLQKLAPVFQRLSKKYPNFILRVISNMPIEIDGVNVEYHRWSLESEQAMLRSFDIGLMPLSDGLWTRGKCGYKLLQYFGVGLPAIASPVGINLEFIDHGINGYLARSENDWYQALDDLMSNVQLRENMGSAGRKMVEKLYGLETYSVNYGELIKSVAWKKN
jgi:glycosyltransferase involved in cell wall biosynthesis